MLKRIITSIPAMPPAKQQKVLFTKNLSRKGSCRLKSVTSDSPTNNIKTGKYGAEYPYINKDVFPLLTKIITDFDVLITDGFRGEDTHKGLPESSKNSLHKYGYSVDLSLGNTEQGKKGQQLYNDLQNDNSLLKKYGILKAMKHNVGGTDHLHLEFNPNN